MRLRPLQIVGLVAVVFFGAKLVWLLTEPKRDPFHLPGAMPVSEPLTPRASAPDAADTSDPLAPAVIVPPPPPTNLLGLGPDDAKDDLYCSGLIFAANRAGTDTTSDEAQMRRDHVIGLANAGVAKLIEAKAADASETAAIADAHTARATEDLAAGTPRITLEACEQRAASLTQTQTKP